MTGLRNTAVLLAALFIAACGGGGGGGSAGPSPPPPPPPPPPPAEPGPTDPGVALARPISASLLCGNGSAKRAASAAGSGFTAAGAGVGINHSHFVEPALWTAEPGSLDSVMRVGGVVATRTDDDCWPDLIFTSGAAANGQLIVYENRGVVDEAVSTRRFDARPPVNLAARANPVAGIGVADLDGDYRLDLVLGNLLAGDTESYRLLADGSLELLQSVPMATSTFGFAFGDYSADGWVDAYAAHWTSAPPAAAAAALLRNAGAGANPRGTLIAADAQAGTTAAAIGHDSNLAPAFADLDRDGDPDLLVASDRGTSAIAIHSGAASFDVVGGGASPLTDENAAGQAVADFDNDGLWDWFVASVHAPGDGRDWPWGEEGNKLYWGSADFPYLTPADPDAGLADAAWPWGVCAEDFNNDGLTDLFVENGFGYTPDGPLHESLDDRQFTRARLFINQGGRRFADESVALGMTGMTSGRGVACLDHDRDGDIDIAVAQNQGTALFYENRHSAADGNGFVSIRLVSAAPNTHALGAVVTVEAGGSVQMRQAAANSNFQGQSAHDLHFGLGSATTVDAVSVRWPDGTVEDYSAMPANRFLTLLDPRIIPYRDAARASRIEAAIAAVTGWVAEDPARLTNDVLLGLTWMQRMHGLTLPFSPAEWLQLRENAAWSTGDEDLALQLNYWRRSFDPAHAISQAAYDNLESFDRLTFAGVYCHDYPLTDENVQDLRDAIVDANGYERTHALLALLWILDNDCPLPASYDHGLLDDAIEAVYLLAEAGGANAITDLRVEAMALLAASGRHDLIQADWVDQLLAAQLASGAWRSAPGESSAEPHTTGVALWLCLMLAAETKVLTGFVAQTWDAY